jgi:hypothetical protein
MPLISDLSAVNPLQNKCICHLFDGYLEVCAFLQISEIHATKSDFENNWAWHVRVKHQQNIFQK